MCFFFQAEDGIRDRLVTGVQTCALPICYPVRFDIDLLRCIFCGFCEMACPEEAIELTEIYDFSNYTRESLLIDKEGLLEVYELTKDRNFYSRVKSKESQS